MGADACRGELTGSHGTGTMGFVRATRVLKQDAFGRVELLEDGTTRCIRRVACGSRIPGSRIVARILMARERRALTALCGTDRVPQLVHDPSWAAVPSAGGTVPDARDVLVRTCMDGTALHECTTLPLDFFDQLEQVVHVLHAHGVAHNDLHKEQNILVGADGLPQLIDFQLASIHAKGSRLLASRVRDDLRHLAKHRRRYLRHTRVVDVAPPAELLAHPPRPPARRGTALLWRRFVKPLYNLVTRRLLRTRDGEARRDTRGAWPQWVGPARRNATIDPQT
ncbi:MAG: hypothetical protein RIT25_204 [Planctomycetota bacterium]